MSINRVFCSSKTYMWQLIYWCVPEVSKTSALLQSLSKHLILADVIITDRAPSKSHRLLKMVFPDLWDWIKVLILQTERNMKTSCRYSTMCVCVFHRFLFPVQRLKVTKHAAALKVTFLSSQVSLCTKHTQPGTEKGWSLFFM